VPRNRLSFTKALPFEDGRAFSIYLISFYGQVILTKPASLELFLLLYPLHQGPECPGNGQNKVIACGIGVGKITKDCGRVVAKQRDSRAGKESLLFDISCGKLTSFGG